MNNDDTPIDPIIPPDSAESALARGGDQNRHVYWLLLAARTSPAGSWTFSEDERASMAQHLTTCEDCRTRVAALNFADRVAVAGAVPAASSQPEQSLAALETIEERATGVSVTEHQTPMDESSELSSPAGAPAVARSRWWKRLPSGARLLSASFLINVRSQWVAVHHDIAAFLGDADDVDMEPAVSFRAIRGPETPPAISPQPRSLIIDLRDEREELDRWVRMRISLQGLYSRRLSGDLRCVWAQPNGSEIPASGIPWSIERGTESIAPQGEPLPSPPLQKGITDALGNGAFVLDDPGDYTLATEVEDQRWFIPFTVRDVDLGAANQLVAATESERQISQILLGVAAITSDNVISAIEDVPAARVRPPFVVDQRLTNFVSLDLRVSRVASGGFGAVAMGPDSAQGGRWVAVKTLNWESLARAGADQVQRVRTAFISEGLISCGFWPHPNVLGVEDLVEINGQPMLVLDYAEQGSLRDLFATAHRRGSWLRLASALHLAQQIATGLLALHTPDPNLLRPDPIVHGDLKPENILLDQAGFARIADMDSVRVFKRGYDQEGPSAGASAERVIGTPVYMAPEQWLGVAHIAPPTDAYAFGLILAELLTSHHPLLSLDLPHTLDDWRAAHTTGRPTPLRQLGAEIFSAERAALPNPQARARQDGALARVEQLVTRLLARPSQARPTIAEALAELQGTAQALGEEPYIPPDTYPATPDHERRFWQGWADVSARFGRYDQALWRIERAIAFAPDNPATLTTYGNILDAAGRHDEALAAYRRALTFTPDADSATRATIYTHLAATLAKQKRYADADAAYADALALTPDNGSIWLQRAVTAGHWASAKAEAGRIAEARAHAESALAYGERARALTPARDRLRDLIHDLRSLRSTL